MQTVNNNKEQIDCHDNSRDRRRQKKGMVMEAARNQINLSNKREKQLSKKKKKKKRNVGLLKNVCVFPE
jgi:hypothetical protein